MPSGFTAGSLVVTGGNIFVGTQGGVYQSPISPDGGTATLIGSVADILGLAVDTTSVYSTRAGTVIAPC